MPDARTPLLAIQMGPTGTCSLLALSYDEIPGMWVVVVQVLGKPLNPKHGIIGYLDRYSRGYTQGASSAHAPGLKTA